MKTTCKVVLALQKRVKYFTQRLHMYVVTAGICNEGLSVSQVLQMPLRYQSRLLQRSRMLLRVCACQFFAASI